MQVNLPKPIGVRFGRGNDGAAYVRIADEAIGNTDERIQVSDLVVAYVLLSICTNTSKTSRPEQQHENPTCIRISDTEENLQRVSRSTSGMVFSTEALSSTYPDTVIGVLTS